MNKILLIIPYFGQFNNYFSLFLESCRNNPTVNWLILTDDTTLYSYPNNVKVVYTTLSEIKSRIEKKLGFDIKLDTPYKLCDFKPTYGYVFDEYLKGYAFWGYCDTDMIFGNIRTFITDDILNKSDKVLSRGHLSLWRNCKKMNEFFMASTNGLYKSVFTSEQNFSFDEWGAKGVAHYIKKYINKDRFWDEIPFDDISTLKGNFVSSQRGKEGLSNTIYRYDHGELQRLSLFDSCVNRVNCKFKNITHSGGYLHIPVLYIHLQKRNLLIKKGVADDQFLIVPPNKFIPYQEIDDVTLMKLGRKIWIYPQYFIIRYRNLLRKLKKFLHK